MIIKMKIQESNYVNLAKSVPNSAPNSIVEKSYPSKVEPPSELNPKDLLKDLLPNSDKVKPTLDLFPFNKPDLNQLAHSTAKAVQHADSQFEKFAILENFVNELNSYSAIMTSFPAKPVYDYSTQDLMSLANSLHGLAYPKCHCENAESYREVLGAVNTALKERQPKPLKPFTDFTATKMQAAKFF